ncbi:alpha/beta fold hydrolase [Catellatospora coxensis]
MDQQLFRQQFAADVPAGEAALMAATQRPATAAALNEAAAGEPAWRTIPSYHLIAEADRTIPAKLQHFGADRAHGVKQREKGASHAVFVSRADDTADLIERAARETD